MKRRRWGKRGASAGLPYGEMPEGAGEVVAAEVSVRHRSLRPYVRPAGLLLGAVLLVIGFGGAVHLTWEYLSRSYHYQSGSNEGTVLLARNGPGGTYAGGTQGSRHGATPGNGGSGSATGGAGDTGTIEASGSSNNVSPASSPASVTVTGSATTSSAWPDATTTGYAGLGLKQSDLTNVRTGSFTITQPGTYTNFHWSNGPVYIDADNVTLRGGLIDGSKSPLIYVKPNHKNLTIDHVTIIGNVDSSAGIALKGDNVAVTNCDISGTSNGILTAALVGNPGVLYASTHFTIQDNYLHDWYPNSTDHEDAIQLLGGEQYGLIQHNTLDGPYKRQTSAIILKADKAGIDHITINDNYLSGGAYTLYVYDAAGGPATNIAVTNNVFVLSSYVYSYFVRNAAQPLIAHSGNVLSDGSAATRVQ